MVDALTRPRAGAGVDEDGLTTARLPDAWPSWARFWEEVEARKCRSGPEKGRPALRRRAVFSAILPDVVSGDAWRSLALGLIERVAGAATREDALGVLFSSLRSRFAFDCASAVSLEGAKYLSFDKPALCRIAWEENGARYLDEGRAVLDAGGALGGIVLDREVLSARDRDRSTFYDEYLRPLGVSSSAMILVRTGAFVTQILSLSRSGPSSFRPAELEALRMLLPTVSLAARAFPGVPSSARTAKTIPSPLTRREAEIVGYLVRGLQNAEIAACVGTSRNTVRNQVQSVFRKLDVSTRAELVAVVLANGWSRGFDEDEREVRAPDRRPA